MTQSSKSIDYNELLKQAYLSIEGLNRKLDRFEKRESEPIAVIGMGCRYPGGVESPDDYWQLLRNGRDGISEVPPQRWDIDAYYDPDPDAEGKMYSRWGGFIKNVARFDARFFGITPREAMSMDPQQRLLLEVTWETLENGGCAPDKLSDSLTGVFVGIGGMDYATLMNTEKKISELYAGTGNTLSVAAGRLSYFLGLQGPCLSVDTACSSSLVSVHLAIQSLRREECHLALAGGVNLVLAPEPTIIFCRGRMLSFGRYCKTFDAAADGYVRGEGCGMVLLKRLSDARADGDRILALIRGSAINQDGRSSGLTAPNGVAQEAVMRAALQNAGVKASQVDYVEAHGTGTSLGDPIELRAINAVLGPGHSQDNPLWVGSVKTNLGHIEAAAGIASLMKAILACQHGQIPPHLHFTDPSPHIPWDAMPIQVPTRSIPWPDNNDHPIAGVSSFGFSGTNAHVIVQTADRETLKKPEAERPLHVLPISAKSKIAIKDMVERYTTHITSQPHDFAGDVCFTAGAGRSHFRQRLAVVAEDGKQLSKSLEVFHKNEADVNVFSGSVPEGGREPKIAFLYTGQGSQYPGMGSDLYETQPTFRKAMDVCDEVLQPLIGKSIIELLYSDSEKTEGGLLNQTRITQPLLFALEYALTKLWQSWGVKPAVVMGHSVGEYVAACVAGVFSLEDGLRLIAERGRMMQALPADGSMAAVFADELRVSDMISEYSESVSIAALNSPENTVISGLSQDIRAVLEKFESQGIKAQVLNVSHAFHSPLMEPMLVEFEKTASAVEFSKPRIRMISNMTGAVVDAESVLRAERWRRHVGEPVRFADSMATLARQGIELFLEVGPHPVLLGMGQQCLPDHRAQWLPSLGRGRSDWPQMIESLSRLYVNGVSVDWQGFDRDYERRKIALPTYPFQRKIFWHDENAAIAFEKQSQARPVADYIQNKLYEVVWESKEAASSQSVDDKVSNKYWLILADKSGLAEAVAKEIKRSGARCTLVFSGDGFTQIGDDQFVLDPYQPEDYKNLLNRCMGRSDTKITSILHLWSLDSSEIGEAQEDRYGGKDDGALFLCGSVIHLLQSLDAADRLRNTHLWIATCGAQSGDEKHISSVDQGVLWGLSLTLMQEHPGFLKGLVDLDQKDSTEQTQQLMAQIQSDDGEVLVRYQGLEYQVPRLKRVESFTQVNKFIDVDETYLITGGLGALGMKMTHWLVDKGARSIVLVGRSEPSDAVKGEIRRLTETGCLISVEQLDISDKTSVDKLFDDIKQSLPPLKGVIHAAGVLDDGIMLNQSLDRFERVMAPKVRGAWNLHCATRDLELRFFVLFSSLVGVFGAAGQGNYAAANAYLDSLSRYRTRIGLPSVAIAWGPWAERGMAADLENERRQRLKKSGMHMIDPDDGLRMLESVMGQSRPQVCAVEADWSALVSLLPRESDRALFSAVADQPASSHGDLSKEADDSSEYIRWQEQSPDQKVSFLEDYLRRQVARIIGTEVEALSFENNFLELGVDSLMITEIINQIQQDFGLSLYAREVFEKPTIDQLAGYMDAELINETQVEIDADQGEEKTAALGSVVTPKAKQYHAPSSELNPPMVFLLSSPRSGSTLLRVMLAGHSQLFCPPELHLLQFSDLAERKESLGRSYLTEGLDRALMELKQIGPEESKALVDDLIRRDQTTRDVYRLLQDSADERILIDKSPTYGADMETLDRAELLFDRPKYIHLVRHPYSVIESFVRNRMDRLAGVKTDDPSRLAEQVWCETNANIIDFLEEVGPDRHLRVLFEDLVRNPEKAIRDVCTFLEVPFEPAVLEPYEGERMTDGLHKKSLGIGDPNFLNRKTIDASLADVWKTISIGRRPNGYTRRIAKEIGYGIPDQFAANETLTEEREEIVI